MKRKVPRLKSDAAVEAFLDQDLSNLDFSQFRPTRFEFEKKTAQPTPNPMSHAPTTRPVSGVSAQGQNAAAPSGATRK